MQEQLPRRSLHPALLLIPKLQLGNEQNSCQDTKNTKLSFELFFVIFVPSW